MGCPALLKVPYQVLRTRWPDDVGMVRNGMGCLVLKIGTDSGLGRLMGIMNDDLERRASTIWNNEDLELPLYFKPKNYLLCDNPKEQDYNAFVNKRLSDDLDEAYKVDAVPRGNGIYIWLPTRYGKKAAKHET